MNCPKCGSPNIQVVNQQIVKGKVVDTRRNKGFGCCTGLIMACIVGPFGWFCGLCGMGKTKGKFKDKRKITNEVMYCCMNCGNQFKLDDQ